MNALRSFKLFVLLLVPVLAAIYAYQFTGQAREEIIPFKPFKVDFNESYGFPDSKLVDLRESGIEALVEAQMELMPLRFEAPVTLVNIWATWCPPCVEEFPAMLELQRRLEEQGVEVVFVSIDEEWKNVSDFFVKHGLKVDPSRLYWDPERKIATAWGTDKFPESYVLRADSWAVERIVGLQQWTRPVVIEYFEKLSKKYAGISGMSVR